MKLIVENTTRKLDNLGRITIPKSLRELINAEAGEELEFYSLEDEGKYYICLSSQQNPPSYKYRVVTKAFEEYGIEVPKDFLEAVAREQFKMDNK